jgi:hypothetical protein
MFVRGTRRRLAARLALFFVLLALLGAVAVSAWFYFAPSSLLKILLHPPRVERIEMVGSGISGTVIDLGGGWFNEGKPTEPVIRSRRTPGGWDVPERITIRNGRLRGAIRVFGMGRNGEASRVRQSSVHEGHMRLSSLYRSCGLRGSGSVDLKRGVKRSTGGLGPLQRSSTFYLMKCGRIKNRLTNPPLWSPRPSKSAHIPAQREWSLNLI